LGRGGGYSAPESGRGERGASDSNRLVASARITLAWQIGQGRRGSALDLEALDISRSPRHTEPSIGGWQWQPIGMRLAATRSRILHGFDAHHPPSSVVAGCGNSHSRATSVPCIPCIYLSPWATPIDGLQLNRPGCCPECIQRPFVVRMSMRRGSCEMCGVHNASDLARRKWPMCHVGASIISSALKLDLDTFSYPVSLLELARGRDFRRYTFFLTIWEIWVHTQHLLAQYLCSGRVQCAVRECEWPCDRVPKDFAVLRLAGPGPCVCMGVCACVRSSERGLGGSHSRSPAWPRTSGLRSPQCRQVRCYARAAVPWHCALANLAAASG
jgi:hypothetical protein